MTPRTKDQNQGPTEIQRYCETKPASKFADYMSFCAFVSPEFLVALTGRCDDARYERPKPETKPVSALLRNEPTAIRLDPILRNEPTAIRLDPILRNEPSLLLNFLLTMSYD
jgi:hypothetical protein